MKNKKIIVIICISILILIISTILLVKETVININNKYSKLNCLHKGNVCTEDEIYDGILLKIKVSKFKSYEFYMIDNDENYMTLIMNKNILDNADWNVESTNLKGPTSALLYLADSTKNWNLISPIKNYFYEDYGYKNYQESCNKNINDKVYDCNNEKVKNRGYKYIKIDNDNLYVEYNFQNQNEKSNGQTFNDYINYSRIITIEELKKLYVNETYPNWLISSLNKGEGYWTLSSSSIEKTGYQSGAYAVLNNDNNVDIDSMYTLNNRNIYKIGIRPVIVVKKDS